MKTPQVGFKVRRHNDIVVINIPLIENNRWEAWGLFQSDHHIDSTKCDRKLLKKHLDQAKQRGAFIHMNGDLFDVMGGNWDKRASKSELDPQFKSDNYLDEVVEYAADFFTPYAHNIATVAEGNHENKIRERLETDLTQRFVGLLNRDTKSSVQNGAYAGWIKLCFISRAGKCISTVRIHYDHGFGADGTQQRKQSIYLPDADLVMTGHTHNFWLDEVCRERISDKGTVYNDTQTHIKIPSYKNDRGKGKRGFAVEKGHTPKVLGAWWARFFWDRTQKCVLFEMIKAQ